MLAIDTNVIVRFLTGDEPAQAARAKALIEGQDIFVSATVLLEAEWVLRSAYGLEKAEVIAALVRLAGLPRLRLDDPVRISKALSWAGQGMDFADALHLAAAEACDAFVTFDRRMVKAKVATGGPPVRQP